MISTMTVSKVLHDSPGRRAESAARRWNIAAVAISAVTGLGAALLPLGTSMSANSNGPATSTRVSLLTNEGPSVLIVVAIPVLLVALPLMLRSAPARHRARVVIVVLLGLLVLLGAMSIGVFFVPTLIAMFMCSRLTKERTQRPRRLRQLRATQ
jgi:cytochrome bd-type quinol oxidase subunit 2